MRNCEMMVRALIDLWLVFLLSATYDKSPSEVDFD